MTINESAFQNLVEISKEYEAAIKALNMQTINLMQNDGMREALRKIALAADLSYPRPNSSLTNAIKNLEKAIPRVDLASQNIAKSLQIISNRYKDFFNEYVTVAMADNTREALERSQITSIAQLCLSNETPMIHDTISCFANAKYEFLPDVLNRAMSGSTIGAADVAFIKVGTIIPIIEKELVYPKGFKSALSQLNKATADDISDNPHIKYDTKSNKFTKNDASIDSRSMNIVCSGIEVIGAGELFTEEELMDFVSFLSRTPMGAAFNDTGKKIHEWLTELYLKKLNIITFDHDIYYHCRSRNSEDAPYTYDEMLKAPYGYPKAGRYNQVGRAHFYFADTRKGAETEVKRHLRKNEVLQTVKIKPKRKIELLDLSGTLQRGTTFLKMIRFPLKDMDNQMPKEYLLPCYVADCCKLIGTEGIKYYGSKEYNNYVSWEDGYFLDAGMCG